MGGYFSKNSQDQFPNTAADGFSSSIEGVFVCAADNPRAEIVFLHGLGGSAFGTWTSDTDNGRVFWPLWLKENDPQLNIVVVEIATQPTNWVEVGCDPLWLANDLLRRLAFIHTRANQLFLSHTRVDCWSSF